MNPAEPAAAHRLAFMLDPRVLAVVLLAYGIARAASLSITHDEALTYLFHALAPWTEVLAHTAPLPSNNHLLNTVAVKALLAVLPATELVLRLPALLGLALFLWAAARLVSRFATGARRQLGFLLLAGNPFVLDLLVLSRGYALGLGLALSAVAVELGGRTGGAARRHALGALCATAAVLANLSFAYVLVAIAVAAATLALVDAAGHRRRTFAALGATAPYAAGVIALATVYTPAVLARIRRPLAEWGGERGIWTDTVPSLADGVLYGARWIAGWRGGAVALVTALVAVVALGAAALLAAPAIRARIDPPTRRVLSAGLVIAALWAAQASVAHAALGVRYPLERGAVFMVPCVTLLLVAVWEAAASASRLAVVGRGIAGTVFVALAHFAFCTNLSTTYLWRYDAAGRAAMRSVGAAAAPLPPGRLRLGVSWMLEPAANFYRVTRNLSGLAPVTREDPRRGFDLYYLASADTGLVDSLRLRPCAFFPAAATTIAAPVGVGCPSPSP
jgi:hypothetical protein